jgi:phytoene dehydrogenase-like protein
LTKRVESVFPGFSQHSVYEESASPHTLYRYTLNYNGAAFGWASLPSQLLTSGLTQTTSIEGLYLSGHWTTQTQGVSGVAYVGHETAKIILKKDKNVNKMVYN